MLRRCRVIYPLTSYPRCCRMHLERFFNCLPITELRMKKDLCLRARERERNLISLGTVLSPEIPEWMVPREEAVSLERDFYFLTRLSRQNLRLRGRWVMVNRIRARTKGWTCLRMSRISFTTHGEWFKIDYNEALGRIQIWWNWMKREPYDLGGALAPEWKEHVEYLSRKNTMPNCSGKNRKAVDFGKASWRPRDCLGLTVFPWLRGKS